MTDKILFLDVDGVLNSRRTALAFGGYSKPHHQNPLDKLDKTTINLLNKLVTEKSIKVVLSSTWRIGSNVFDMTTKLGIPIHDVTPILDTGIRGDEIQLWLELNHVDGMKFVIVDDDKDMLEEQLPFFVHVDRFEGFSYKNLEQVLQILDLRLDDCFN